MAENISNLTTVVRRKLSVYYPRYVWLKTLISACNFIIVRTNGNRFVEFELSNICNARCVFCPYPDMLKSEKKFTHMQADTFEKVKQMMTTFKGVLVSFTPTTGDTLLHPKWNVYMSELIAMKNVSRSTMFTNAIELDSEAQQRLLHVFELDKAGKMSQLYFSVGGYDASTYKALYQVDRFDKVVKNIRELLDVLKREKFCIGIHIHIKLKTGDVEDLEKAEALFNPAAYPFVYYSHSHQYFSNDAYTRNALLDYYPSESIETSKACAYLKKTRFAADGGVWADGCVISEMPSDHSLQLGNVETDLKAIEQARTRIIQDWEQKGVKPLPCRGCTMYRA